MTRLLGATSLAIVLVAVSAESVWQWVTGRRRAPGELRTALAMGVGALFTAALFRRVDSTTWPLLGQLTPAALTAFWDRTPLLEAISAFVAWDAAGFAYHWTGHRTRVGWASHQVHHAGTGYDLSLALRQSWLPLPALVTFPAVALAGFDLPLVLACAAVSNTWQALLHTSIDVRTPRWFTATVMTPATDRRHHAVGLRAANLGPVFTVWDRLAGTWDPRPVAAVLAAEPTGLGAVGRGRTSDSSIGADGTRTTGTTGALRIETAGWAELMRSCSRRASRTTFANRSVRSAHESAHEHRAQPTRRAPRTDPCAERTNRHTNTAAG